MWFLLDTSYVDSIQHSINSSATFPPMRNVKHGVQVQLIINRGHLFSTISLYVIGCIISKKRNTFNFDTYLQKCLRELFLGSDAEMCANNFSFCLWWIIRSNSMFRILVSSLTLSLHSPLIVLRSLRNSSFIIFT